MWSGSNEGAMAPVPVDETLLKCPPSVTPLPMLYDFTGQPTSPVSVSQTLGPNSDELHAYVNTFTYNVLENPEDTRQSNTNCVKATYIKDQPQGVLYNWMNQGGYFNPQPDPTWTSTEVKTTDDWQQGPMCDGVIIPSDPIPPQVPPFSEQLIHCYMDIPVSKSGRSGNNTSCHLL